MANVNKPTNDAKKVALNLYFKMFHSMHDIKIKALEIPIEFLDKQIFGAPEDPDDGLVDKLYNKLATIINVKPETTSEPEIKQGSELEELTDDMSDMDMSDMDMSYELGDESDDLVEL